MLDDQLIKGYHPQDLSDYQLIALLESGAHTAELEPLLRKELKRRALDVERYKDLKLEFDEPLFDKSGKALPWWLKVVLVVLPFYLLHAISAQGFRHCGYERRWKQCWRLLMLNSILWAIAIILFPSVFEWFFGL